MTKPALTPVHRTQPTRLRRRLSATAVVLATTVATAGGCANQASDRAEPAPSSNVSPRGSAPADPAGSESPEGGQSPASAAKQRITTAGVAALVTNHLGAENIVSFGRYAAEPGQVHLLVRLRGSGRNDMFLVTVYSPKHGGEVAPMAKCPRRKQLQPADTKEFTCHKLPHGTTVTAYLTPYGFSDNNAHGHVISGLAAAPDKSATMIMYESYNRTAPIRVTDVDRLLSDPRLAWMTDPELNAAGKALTIETLRG